MAAESNQQAAVAALPAISANLEDNAPRPFSIVELICGKDAAPPPPDWRAEIRVKIAARVEHAALEGTWLNEMVNSSKSSP